MLKSKVRMSKREKTMRFNPGKQAHRRCVYCGGSGSRTQVLGGWAHKRCLPTKQKKVANDPNRKVSG